MIAYQDIRDVHLEISTFCNASCPWCPRNFWGYPYNGGYPEVNMTLESAQQIFSRDFLQQLTSIRINGNYGDIVMNPQSADIVQYFLSANPALNVKINTNGSARPRSFWQRLGELRIEIHFALDGLEDTHHLYRQNTSWKRVISNAQTFIASGGQAVWQMIRFKHNQHQIDQCRKLSETMGFQSFNLINSGRDTAPVFDRRGNLTHVLGDYTGEREFKVLFHNKKTDQVMLEDITQDRIPARSVDCETKRLRSIYIAANGDVSPCCFMGFYPKTYGHGQYYEAANAQLKDLITKNNALEYPLEECIRWFESVERAWKIDSYQDGRLVICDDNCGRR